MLKCYTSLNASHSSCYLFPQAQSYDIAKATDLSVANTALEQFRIWCAQSSSAEWLQLFASVVQDY